jgi:hypothetical protein
VDTYVAEAEVSSMKVSIPAGFGKTKLLARLQSIDP